MGKKVSNVARIDSLSKKEGILRLYIPLQYYFNLADAHKDYFMQTTEGKFLIEFPIDNGYNELSLSTCVTSCIEAALIIPNPKYEIDQNTTLDSELLKLGKSGKSFQIFITITYLGQAEKYHDIMLFQEVNVEENLYEFELLGDQTLFKQ